MARDTQFFINLKAKLEKARKERDEAQGELKGIIKMLKSDFDVSSEKEARKKLKELEAEYKELDEKITDMVDDLKKEFDND